MAFGKIRNLFKMFHRIVAEKTNPGQRVKYLRSIGVKIGENCRIDTVHFSTEPYLVSVGNHVAISSGTLFITHDGAVRNFKPEVKGGIFGKITIEDNVFIGQNCVIVLNTKIGKNSIIGAGSVVRGIIPENSLVLGNPGKVICNVSALKFFYQNSPCRIQTDGLTPEEKDKLVKQILCNI
jgi:acetyltransferase-like isoleucine patch superfamily enzyme